jgi:hypothetical protein
MYEQKAHEYFTYNVYTLHIWLIYKLHVSTLIS